jgi:murein DD-endopeptidase MepM/ murein hydrolase activator NlpD
MVGFRNSKLGFKPIIIRFTTLKYFKFAFIFLTLFGCVNSENQETIDAEPTEKQIQSDFGFDYRKFYVVQDTIKVGDAIGNILEKQNLGNKNVHQVVAQITKSFNARSIKPNRPFTLLTQKSNHLLEYFIYENSSVEYTVINFKDSVVTVIPKKRPITLRTKMIGGVLKGSLSETLYNAKIDPALASKITKVYAWSIDFFKLQKGDRFGIILKERYINDSIYNGVEDFDAAFFEYKNKIIYAFPFVADTLTNKVEYYNEEGNTLKNFFLKTPIKFSRLTSRFSANRFHPVQQTWKAHKGTDYAAPQGTPITTTASGIVEKTGYTAGNGNYVKVKHNATYSTQYLHMSKILVKRGQSVKQGDVIGRVGSTGLATGPHVCYRFWKNGIQVDPLRLKLPNGVAIEPKDRARYLQQIEPLKMALDSIGNL